MTDNKTKLIHHIVLSFLKEHFTPFTLSQFHASDTHFLYQEIKKVIPLTELSKRTHEVQEAIESFFGTLGEMSVRFEGLKNIIITTNIDTSTQKTLELLKQYQESFEVHETNNIIIIDEKTTQMIFSQTTTSEEQFRHNIRVTLPYLCDIGKKYAVLFARSRITVRTKLEEVTVEQRFSGLPVDDLESWTKKHFKDYKSEVPALLRPSLLDIFNFATMSNEEFESKHIQLIQKELIKLLKLRSTQELEVIKALSNYILRNLFDVLHSMLARQLLSDVLNRKGNAELFLNFFSNPVTSINGKKYQVPQLIDTNGTVWSLPNIKSIAAQYHSLLSEMQTKSDFIDKMDAVLDTIDDEIEEAEKALESTKKRVIENNSKLDEHQARIKELRKVFLSTQGTNAVTLDVSQLTIEIKEVEVQEREAVLLREQLDKSLNTLSNKIKALILKKSTTHERHNSEVDKYEAIESKHSEVISRYELMITAITKALMSKKTAV